MDNIYIYLVRLPAGINESVEPCLDGYTIYIEETLSPEAKLRSYNHAMEHIKNGDFWNETMTASQMEMRAHGL